MATLLLFTLGTGAYRLTPYREQDRRVETRFAARALRAFHDLRFPDAPIDRAIVWVTPEARRANLEGLTADWAQEPCPLETRDMPTPAGEAEFWNLFEGLAAAITDGDRVVLEVTHGFRSMPLVAMLAVAYIRAVRRDVEVVMVGYGQFTEGAAETPYLDLTPLVSLLDWTHAVQRLRDAGDAGSLAALLKASQRGAFARAREEGWASPRLNNVATLVERLALALRTLRFEEIAQTAAGLVNALDALGPADREGARPFMEVVPALRAEVEPLARAGDGPPLTDLARHRRTLEWLFVRGAYFPYVAMLYEALVAHVAEVLDLNRLAEGDNARLKELHHFAAVILSGARLTPDGGERPIRPWVGDDSAFQRDVIAQLDQATYRAAWRETVCHEAVALLAEKVGRLRNGLLHAGFSASEASREGARVVAQLEGFHREAMTLPIWR